MAIANHLLAVLKVHGVMYTPTLPAFMNDGIYLQELQESVKTNELLYRLCVMLTLNTQIFKLLLKGTDHVWSLYFHYTNHTFCNTFHGWSNSYIYGLNAKCKFTI